MNTDTLEQVRDFWDTEACGHSFVAPSPDDRSYFARYRAFRYRSEWHIPAFARFELARGQRVLEIGCGNGADGAMFAAHGARYTGVDLTEEAVSATRRHLAAIPLKGDVRVANAERLPFDAKAFDIVYSYGVLHHTPEPEAALREVHRVLRPGGVALVMLYHRHSFNYYVRILGYMRARLLLMIAARAHRIAKDRARLAALPHGLIGARGNDSTDNWELHYDNFLERGWRYLRADNFVHHCTDGPECPCAFVYGRSEAARLFGDFRTVEMRTAHFPINKYPVAKLLPRALEPLLAAAMGWHLLIRAVK